MKRCAQGLLVVVVLALLATAAAQAAPPRGLAEEARFALPSADHPYDAVGLDPQGRVFVLDRLQREVLVFSSDGRELDRWPVPDAQGTPPASFGPTQLAVSPDGFVVVGPDSGQLQRFTADGRPVGWPGRPDGVSYAGRFTVGETDELLVGNLGLAPDGTPRTLPGSPLLTGQRETVAAGPGGAVWRGTDGRAVLVGPRGGLRALVGRFDAGPRGLPSELRLAPAPEGRVWTNASGTLGLVDPVRGRVMQCSIGLFGPFGAQADRLVVLVAREVRILRAIGEPTAGCAAPPGLVRGARARVTRRTATVRLDVRRRARLVALLLRCDGAREPGRDACATVEQVAFPTVALAPGRDVRVRIGSRNLARGSYLLALKATSVDRLRRQDLPLRRLTVR